MDVRSLPRSQGALHGEGTAVTGGRVLVHPAAAARGLATGRSFGSTSARKCS